MKRFITSILILTALALWCFRGKLFASMPPIHMTDSHVLLGNAPGDHALYAMSATCEIHAASVGYEFNSPTMGFFPKLGARGIISFMNPTTYQALEQASARTGTCMANYLNECQHKGEIQHLVLVPQNTAALDQMRHASIPAGQAFHLQGRYLAYQEGTIDGKRFNGDLSGTGYFLVESIRQN